MFSRLLTWQRCRRSSLREDDAMVRAAEAMVLEQEMRVRTQERRVVKCLPFSVCLSLSVSWSLFTSLSVLCVCKMSSLLGCSGAIWGSGRQRWPGGD